MYELWSKVWIMWCFVMRICGELVMRLYGDIFFYYYYDSI